MRTTLTLDDDLAGILQKRSRELGKPFREIVNATLRRGLSTSENLPRPKVTVRPHDFGPSPALDFDRLNQLVDELEVEDYLRKAAPNDSSRR